MNPPRPTIRYRKRAGAHLCVDLTDSANLYRSDYQAKLYRDAVQSSAYQRLIGRPFREASEQVPTLLSQLGLSQRTSLQILDCGPADGEAAVAGLDAITKEYCVERYTVVDINSQLLSSVAKAVKAEFDIEVYAVLGPFEEYRARRSKSRTPVLVLVGNTAMNYEPADLSMLLARLARPGDPVMIQVMLRTRGSDQLTPYRTRAVRRFVFEPLKQLGIQPDDVRSFVRSGAHDVTMGFSMRRAKDLPEAGLFLHRGDSILAAKTMRYTRASYAAMCKTLFSKSVTRVGPRSVATTVGYVRPEADT